MVMLFMTSLTMIHTQKIESFQYSAVLPISGTTSRIVISRNSFGYHWIRHLHMFYKMLLTKISLFIYELVPSMRNIINIINISLIYN